MEKLNVKANNKIPKLSDEMKEYAQGLADCVKILKDVFSTENISPPLAMNLYEFIGAPENIESEDLLASVVEDLKSSVVLAAEVGSDDPEMVMRVFEQVFVNEHDEDNFREAVMVSKIAFGDREADIKVVLDVFETIFNDENEDEDE